jgi:amino acid transporter
MTVLARALRVLDYFTLAFGTMVGAGWLVVMDDWLRRGGPAGAMLGFAVGGVALLPVGWVYGKLAGAIPDAASEVAYTERVFPQSVSLLTGWMMVLAYGIVCPWEAAAIGKIAAYLLPPLNRWPLGLLGGQPLPRVLTGLVLTAAITTVNYRGIRWSSRLQNWATLLLWLLFAAFGAAGLLQGQAANLQPLFAHAPGVAVLLMLQVVPYFMTGFEAVPKCAEESVPDFPVEGFLQAMVLAIGVATVFYVGVIGVVAWVAPWRELMDRGFLTAVAFEHTIGRGWWVRMQRKLLGRLADAVCAGPPGMAAHPPGHGARALQDAGRGGGRARDRHGGGLTGRGTVTGADCGGGLAGRRIGLAGQLPDLCPPATCAGSAPAGRVGSAGGRRSGADEAAPRGARAFDCR